RGRTRTRRRGCRRRGGGGRGVRGRRVRGRRRRGGRRGRRGSRVRRGGVRRRRRGRGRGVRGRRVRGLRGGRGRGRRPAGDEGRQVQRRIAPIGPTAPIASHCSPSDPPAGAHRHPHRVGPFSFANPSGNAPPFAPIQSWRGRACPAPGNLTKGRDSDDTH